MAFREIELTEEERAALGAKFFKFDAIGDRLVGRFLRSEERDGKFGRETLYHFKRKTEAGQIEEVALSSGGNSDAIQKLRKAAIKPGVAVMVTFTATLDVGKANPMKMFKVLVDDSPAATPTPAPKPKPADDDLNF
jgi:hypothetical protein